MILIVIITAVLVARSLLSRRHVPATRRELERAYRQRRADLSAMRSGARRRQYVPVIRSVP